MQNLLSPGHAHCTWPRSLLWVTTIRTELLRDFGHCIHLCTVLTEQYLTLPHSVLSCSLLTCGVAARVVYLHQGSLIKLHDETVVIGLLTPQVWASRGREPQQMVVTTEVA